jgi:hypothetical protein
VMRDTPVTQSSSPAAQQALQSKVGSTRRRMLSPQPTPAPVVPQTTRVIAPAEPPGTTAPPVASTGPVTATVPVGAAAQPTAPAAPPPAPTTETTTTTAPTLPGPAQTIAADTVDQATATVTATVQQTTQAVANVVTTIVDPHPLLP